MKGTETHIEGLMIDFQRGANSKRSGGLQTVRTKHCCSHFAKIDDLLRPSGRVSLDDSQWCTNAKSSVQDINAQDDRVALTKRGDDLQSARPDGGGRCITPLGFHNFLVVCLEGIEEMVDDIGYEECKHEEAKQK